MIALFWIIGIACAEVTISPEEEKDGFHLLFNGKDLTGFVEVQGRPGAFTVENGVLCGTREGLKAYWLSTEKKFGDFELRLEYMLTPGGNRNFTPGPTVSVTLDDTIKSLVTV